MSEPAYLRNEECFGGMRPKQPTETGSLQSEIDRLRAENQRLKLAALTADRESMELEAKNQRLREAVDEVRDLIKESYGVAGLHQNGDVAEWSELLPGGNFEGWLLNLGELAELPEGDINADTE